MDCDKCFWRYNTYVYPDCLTINDYDEEKSAVKNDNVVEISFSG